MQADPLFELSQVTLRIGDQEILHNVSCSVKSGEFLAILGASGAGKSTLLRMFNALSSPTSGKLTFRGQALDTDIINLRKHVGILFQNPIVFSGRVKDNLLAAGRWNPRIAQLLDHELKATLDQVGLSNISLTHQARDLSGGEQQRLALARTLLNHPEVLLLDEPTSNLDPKLSRSIMDLVNQLHGQLNLTVIAVSHDHLLMRRYVQRVILLNQGRIAGDGSFAALDADNAFEKAGLLNREADDEA